MIKVKRVQKRLSINGIRRAITLIDTANSKIDLSKISVNEYVLRAEIRQYFVDKLKKYTSVISKIN